MIFKNFFHDVLGWAEYDLKRGKDKNGNYKCKYCDYCVDTDSTGAHFHLNSKFKTK